jgi:threonine-phosphate decarboxylase
MKRDHGGAPGVRIDASVNLNPLGPPGALNAVFARARELAARYPEIDAVSAREAWARRLATDVEQVIVGNGASELISLAIRAIEPRRVLVFDPCYSEYEAAASAGRIEVVHLPLVLRDSVWSTPADPPGVCAGDLVVVCQPNNPTGHLTPVEQLLALAETGAHVLVDESFLALSAAGDSQTLVSDVSECLTVVQSLTKTFCVPGLRLGVLVGDASLVAKIAEIRDPWSVNGIAAEAALVLAGADEYLARARALLSSERARMAAGFSAIEGVRVTEGEAPFLLLELPEGAAAAELRSRLLARGIAVRDASTFRGLGERWVRIGLRTPAENSEVLRAVAAELAGLTS